MVSAVGAGGAERRGRKSSHQRRCNSLILMLMLILILILLLLLLLILILSRCLPDRVVENLDDAISLAGGEHQRR